MSEQDFCLCEAYIFWYTEVDIDVCRCGHPKGEHVDSLYLCTGITYSA